MYTFLSALRYVEDAEVSMFRNYGLLDFFYPHLPRIYLEVSYREPARFEDEVTVALAIDRLGESSLHFLFQISRESIVCAEGRYGVCYLGPDGKPAPIPGDICRILLPK
jgi:acyl-CoA thioesterase FadM